MEIDASTLLIVDDNEDNLFVLSQVIQECLPDCHILTAQNAQRGIELAKSTMLAGVLIDVHMPKMDGIEMCQCLKENDDTAAIPTILITSHSADGKLKAQGLEAGADDFIMRPIDNLELVARLKVMLRIRRAENALCAEKQEVNRLLKEKTSKLVIQEKSYRTLVDSLPDAILKFDKNEKLCYVNPAASEFLGSVFVGQKLTNLTLPECYPECWRNKIRELFATAEANEGEFEIESKENKVFDWRLLPERGERGEIVGTMLILRDITYHRELENKLRHAEKMQAIGHLAAGVAHDFNNQLAGIMGYAELLTHRLQKSELIAHAQAIVKSVQRSADLTSQLLAFARKGKKKSSAVDIHQVIDDVVTMLKRTIDKRISVEKALRAKHYVVLGDSSLLQSALLNMGINARDAMPDGGKLIFATQVLEAKESFSIDVPCLQISICDNGIGIDERVYPRIFEPFFTTKKPGKGTGMGLAAVYGTVKSHGGEIVVTSKLGQGSTFDIYLPLAGNKSEIANSDIVDKGNGHILVVDDERSVRESSAALLHELGYTVSLCKDGVEALATYRKEWRKTDLVILDVVMPKIGGRKTLIGLRDINANVKVLITSGYSLDGEAQVMMASGALGFLHKPCSTQILAAKVANALKRKAPESNLRSEFLH